MCKSIAQTWKSELYPERFLQHLQAPVSELCAHEEHLHSLGLLDEGDLLPQQQAYEKSVPKYLSQKEYEQWRMHLLKYHRASGHASNYNLARIIRDAGRPKWQVQAALDLRCDDCAAMKLGGISSGKIPSASMRPLPKAWECVGMDCTEWTPPRSKVKYMALVMMDLATKFKIATILFEVDPFHQ